MSDVRAAAERLRRRNAETYEEIYGVTYYNGSLEAADERTLAEAYLSEHPAEGPSDGEMLDWLDEHCRTNRRGRWDGPERDEYGCGGPSFWQDPYVSWTLRSKSVRCGTYDMPQELSALDIREAIRQAMGGGT